MQNFSKMMKEAQKLQSQMTEAQERAAQIEVEGSSGAGLVTVRMNGKGEIRGLSIDASLLNPEEKEMLEDLIIAAVSDAKQKSDSMMAAEMQKMMGGVKLPGGMNLPF